jgi:hypothetical protein
VAHRGKSIGQTFRRGEPGYEAARAEALWNQRLPDRYPDLIVQANDVYDVVAAVRMAKSQGLRVGVKSGGHSWAGNHIRDGGLLLDVSRLDDVQIDKSRMRATAGPGRAGHELGALLARERLFFPAGHCRGVAIGGYLLQGGYGWHSRVLGPACMSVLGLDVVTAAGDLVHASPKENPDLYWAARGAGPGFFGVVTRFHLQLYERPRVIGFAAQTFSVDHLEEVVRWLHKIGPEVPGGIELQMLMSRHTPGVRGAGMTVVAPVFAESLGEAWRLAPGQPADSVHSLGRRPDVSRRHDPLPRRPSLRGRQHVDRRVDRRAAARRAPHRRNASPCPVAHAVDELGAAAGAAGHGLLDGRRYLPGAVRGLEGRPR